MYDLSLRSSFVKLNSKSVSKYSFQSKKKRKKKNIWTDGFAVLTRTKLKFAQWVWSVFSCVGMSLWPMSKKKAKGRNEEVTWSPWRLSFVLHQKKAHCVARQPDKHPHCNDADCNSCNTDWSICLPYIPSHTIPVHFLLHDVNQQTEVG